MCNRLLTSRGTGNAMLNAAFHFGRHLLLVWHIRATAPAAALLRRYCCRFSLQECHAFNCLTQTPADRDAVLSPLLCCTIHCVSNCVSHCVGFCRFLLLCQGRVRSNRQADRVYRVANRGGAGGLGTRQYPGRFPC
jgi:hypothetical protein